MAAETGIDREALVLQALLAFARNTGYAPQATPPTPAPPSPPPVPHAAEEGGRQAVAERVLRTAEALERAIIQEPTPADAVPRAPTPAPARGPAALYLVGEDGELDKVVKDRFVIGRGKHCDLVIDSGKVSREHAAIVREAGAYFIEDLGSSNGTWFRGERIEGRKVEHGDEYFLSAENLRCALF